MIVVPIRIESTQNLREPWAKKGKRSKMHRETAFWALRAAKAPQAIPSLVRLTRIAPRVLDDDNCIAGFKATRDGIADFLGIKDNDPRVKWTYAQEKGEPKQYLVTIELL